MREASTSRMVTDTGSALFSFQPIITEEGVRRHYDNIQMKMLSPAKSLMLILLSLIGLCTTACGGDDEDDEPDYTESSPTEVGGSLVMTAELLEGFDGSALDGTRWNIGDAYCANKQTKSGIDSQFRIMSTRKGGLSIITFNTNEVTKAQEGKQLSVRDFYGKVEIEGNYKDDFHNASRVDILIEKVTDKFVVLKINELRMMSYLSTITLKGTVVCRRDVAVSSEPKEPEETDLSAGEKTNEETATKEIKKGSLSYKRGGTSDDIEIYHNSFRYVLSCGEKDIYLNRQKKVEISSAPGSVYRSEWRNVGNVVSDDTGQRTVYCGIKDIGEAGSLMAISEKLDLDIDGEFPASQEAVRGHGYICAFRTLDNKLRYMRVRVLSSRKIIQRGGERTYWDIEYQLY